ncbi:SusC/RagA family TonB-linked outer membrane protein [Portibacter marinus]|uniref:SusC/RagA family TonB-linked outer membrane protein n=1 Tax=Portibacter marinus TaxID=2898660 RepID=UPI001F4695EA|nr:SusC/RagA family TonB-linked outer membrane protein [Portibacter marinus]
MKKFSLYIVAFLVMIGAATGQREITGTVTDISGVPLIGANVTVQGTTNGTITDIDGTYTLSVADAATTLVFSYTGFETQEVLIDNQSTIDVVLSEGIAIDEIVVTGLGIKKEKKALGYGVATIGKKQLTARQETDVARMLRGQATGVDITQTSGLAGSGTNIIIRGYSTITGSNQPLFVVDGVPFNTNTNTTTGTGFGSGSATSSSRFLDLDPNTIEEISILKGLSATVLYGEAGRNGVVLVTTKSGNGGADVNKKTEISVTQGVFQSEIANLPEYQNTYGNGFNAGFGWFFSNWGAAFDDLRPSSYGSDYKGEKDGRVIITHPYDQGQYLDDFPEFAGAEYLHQPYESVENFFQPGFSSNTSVSISSKLNNNSSITGTYSYLTEEGFTPRKDERNDNARSNFLDKHNFSLGAQTTLSSGLRMRGSFNYVSTARETPLTGTGFGGDGEGLFGALLFTPRSVDLMGLPYQSPIDGSNVYYRRGSPIQNPRWTLNNTGTTEDIQRFFSTSELSYDINDNFTVLYRLGIDRAAQKNRRYVNRGGTFTPDGEMFTTNVTDRITDQLANVLYNFQLSPSFSIDGVVGFNARRVTAERDAIISSNQFVYGFINHGNFIDNRSFSGRSEENTLGAFATATLGYNSFLYLTLQGRNDWTSTLEPGNNSIFYPSASLSFVPTDAIAALQNNSILNYLKFRVGYGTSAGYPDPYSTRNVLDSRTNVFVGPGGQVLNTNGVSSFLGNANLMPELFVELEGGVEARFLQNRVGVDLSLYNKTSNDLIINLPLDPATGFTTTTVNAAEVNNRGIELGVDITPIVAGDFSWDLTLNYTRNISLVNEIFEGIERVYVDGFGTLGNYAIPGEPYGVIYGRQFSKNEEGKIFVDGQGGYVRGGFGVIADPNPEYTANWMNNFSYKGMSLGWQFQYVHGGQLYSSTVGALLARGNTVDSDFDRSVPIVLPNGVNADGTPNNKQVYVGDEAFNTFFTDEGAILDATVIRLRQLSFAYNLPNSLLDKTPFGRLGLTISGENLWYNAPNIPKGMNYDPEVVSTGVGNGRGLDFRTAPTAKKYGITLSATF